MRETLVGAARGDAKCLAWTTNKRLDDRAANHLEIERHVIRPRKVADAGQARKPRLDLVPVGPRSELQLETPEDESHVLQVQVDEEHLDRANERGDEPGTITSFERELAVVND